MEKVILFIALLMCGCATTQQPITTTQTKIIDNEKKDSYIDFLENEASEGSAALISVAGSIGEPSKKIIDLTITRLSGIKKPTEEQVERYRLALNNKAELTKQVNIAKRVEEESDVAWAEVARIDEENKSLKEQVKLLEAQRQLEIRQKSYDSARNTCNILGGVLTIIGVGLSLASIWIGKGLKGGVAVVAIGAFIIFLPLIIQDVVESQWFKITIGVSFVVCLLFGIFRLFHTHKHITSLSKANSEPSS
jgi:predicted RND superfamily exporter protein